MLPLQVRQRLKSIHTTEAGCIFKNPVDLNVFSGPEMLLNTVETIAACDQVDLPIIHLTFDAWALIEQKDIVRPYLDSILKLNTRANKPLAVVLHCVATSEGKRFAAEAHLRLSEAGFPVYPSVGRAATAINKVVQYHEHHQMRQEDDS